MTNDIGEAGLTLYNEEMNSRELLISEGGVTERLEVYFSTYSIYVGDQRVQGTVRLDSGGVYTIIIAKDSGSYVGIL